MNGSITLPGYELGDLLYDGIRTLVYRGVQIESQRAVVLKFLKSKYPTFNELVQFRNQYAITKNLDLPGTIRPLTLERYGNSYVLVMEDFGCISLSKYLQNQSISLEEFFPIALQLVQILAGLYQNRIIHKDIKPQNILINPKTHQVFLIDFSIATLLPKETQEIQNPNVLEGTLAYMSPEQTGRMNRGIDYRSDFYSLGVTFYEILSGKLPFESEDPMQLLHCHLAVEPQPLEAGKNLPEMLQKIAMKLMKKNAESRYQNALGLKYDLEVCRQEWQQKGDIDSFELGKRDLADRFIISEKIYGRETEIETLLDAFNRASEGRSEIIMVAGFSGIGKTAAVNEVHKPIVRQRGYFIKGKFDQFNRNIPLSAFVIALRNLTRQLLSENAPQIQQWKEKILEAVGGQGQVLVEVIPELEGIIGKQPPAMEISGGAAQNRFNRLFEQFIQVFSTREHPLVIFLDDLQWADSASLKLIEVLMESAQTSYLLLMGAYRDNEVSPTHPLMLSLEEIQKKDIPLNTIILKPLNHKDINSLVADTLGCSVAVAKPLTDNVYSKAKGNPFFTNQFLKALREDGLIEFDAEAGCWQCDIARVKALSLREDVVEFMATRLQRLPIATQEMLQLAACIGNQFDLQTLAIVSKQSLVTAATRLWKALQEELVLPETTTYKFFAEEGALPETISGNFSAKTTYKFLHDRVQQAAYLLIDESQKQVLNLKIGRLLWENISPTEREERIFTIVDRYNAGEDLIETPEERELLARLNLQAGTKAKAATAYSAALSYFVKGNDLLPQDRWQSQYELTLTLSVGAAEAAYLQADFEEADRWSAEILERATSVLDRVKCYEIKIQAFMAQNQPLESIRTALEVLKELGVELSESPEPSEIQEMLGEVASLCADKSLEDFIALPEMTEPEKIAALRILCLVLPPVTIATPALFPIIVAQQVLLCLRYGNDPFSAFAYVNYGFLCCAVSDIESGDRFGQLALIMLERFDAQNLTARVLMTLHTFVYFWKHHLRESFAPLLEGYRMGLETGDIEFAGYAVVSYCFYSFFVGKSLLELEPEVVSYELFLKQIKLEPIAVKQSILHQLALNLLGRSELPQVLRGEAYDAEVMELEHERSGDGGALVFSYFLQALLYYLFGFPQQALEKIALLPNYIETVRSTVFMPQFHYYNALIRLDCYKTATSEEREETLSLVAEDIGKLKEWTRYAPMNFYHLSQLVEAERCRVTGDRLEAMEAFDRAIASARENGYIIEEALANERAAIFYREWGKEKIARTYITDAYYAYARWGAKAKIEQLQRDYPEDLASITKSETPPLSLSATVTWGSTRTGSATGSNVSEILDLSSAFKAAQAIGQEIELEQLISKVMTLTLESAGASQGSLVAVEGDRLLVMARCHNSRNCQLFSTPIEEVSDIPVGPINYVFRTQETLLLNDVEAETDWAGDSYIQRYRPKSLLCLPLRDRGKIVGILHLENNLATGAFTRDRLSVLKILATQGAISLENARLYREAQNYASQLEGSLVELQVANQSLQETQLQLVQSEKMATVGQLTAGRDREINNPLGFISGNLDYASEYVQNLTELLQLYRQGFANNSDTIQEKISEIELDYLLEDLPELISSMKEGTERIAEISLSMRTFSRADTDAKVPFNIHDGIDSTLLILKYRLKSNENRPEIEVVKNYGYLPDINCYPGQLNQVFMNLLANAIDAIEEANEGKTYEEIKANPNRITITTEISEEKQKATIRIADSGPGMPEEVKKKIFEHLFTTKGVGKGTGLGLSISRQIVEDKHGGKITLTSEVGRGTEFCIALPLS